MLLVMGQIGFSRVQTHHGSGTLVGQTDLHRVRRRVDSLIAIVVLSESTRDEGGSHKEQASDRDHDRQSLLSKQLVFLTRWRDKVLKTILYG